MILDAKVRASGARRASCSESRSNVRQPDAIRYRRVLLSFHHATHADVPAVVALVDSAYRGEADLLEGAGPMPFPYGSERFGVPTRDDLRFAVLEKALR